MPTAQTGAEHYFEKQRADPHYESEFQAARHRIAQVDSAVNELLTTRRRIEHRTR